MTTPLRVLVAEDSEDDALLLVRQLRRSGYEPSWERVEDAEAMRAALYNGNWEIVLSDSSMPHFSATAALAILQETGIDVPFVIVSGTIGEEAAVEAMRAGARDFLLKGKLGRLAPVIERELRESKVRAARRLAEEALHTAAERHRVLFESSPLPMWVFDGETRRFLAVNDAAIRHYGYAHDRFLAMTVDDIRHLGCASVQESRAGQLEEMEICRHRREDGSVITAEVTAREFLFEGKRSRLAVANDVTERHRIEAQLRQAQKMEAVGRLAGGIAHDFNNVLSVILGYGEMLLGDLPPDATMRNDIEEIRKAAQRAADLTRQLLMFSRQQVAEPKVLDLNVLVLGVDKMLRRLLGADVEMTTAAAPLLGRVRVDPGSMEQVVMNLVVNARDAMPTGGKLTIETANVTLDEAYARDHLEVKPGPYIMLAVSDTGTGMDSATQARIFEPFFTTKDVGKGTGLGLATVFGIVQQSGGSVLVTSAPACGTTFKVYLPRVDADTEPLRVTTSPTTLRGSETILLVEDDEQVRAVIQGILRKAGYTLLAASRPSEALAASAAHTSTIDLLITDVVMPDMGGPQLARLLSTSRPHMKVLCMSGYTDDSIVRHGVIGSRMAYLQKPITPEALTTRVREVLGTATAEDRTA